VTNDGRPKIGKDFNPGGARWCEQHGSGRLECTKNRTKGRGPCHGPAVRGTNACTKHSGKRTMIARAQGEARVEVSAWSAMGETAKPISAGMAVLGMLQASWLRCGVYGELLRRQVAVQGDQAGDASEDAPETSGLIGFKYGAAGKDGTIYAQNEEIRALVQLEAMERDRVVKFAKVAHDMGISERLTSMAEMWGDLVAMRITGLLEGLQLSAEQMVLVPRLLEIHLGSIDLGTLNGPDPDGL